MCQRDLSGSRVILTGASSGIGWYLASRLIGEGAKVVVSGRRQERLSRLRVSLGNPARLIAVAGDLCDVGHREKLVNATVDAWGGIDILINNAGVGAVGRFGESSPQRLREIFELDFFAAAELTRLAIPWLKLGSKPAICNISSVLAYRGVPLKSEYCAAKFALRGWSESLRVELIQDGIKLLMVAPSTTRSEFFNSLIDSNETPARGGPWAQSAEAVAGRVCRVLTKGRRESILTFGGKAFVAFSYWWPWATDRLLKRFTQ
jgi:short-subunit dehydrogenase